MRSVGFSVRRTLLACAFIALAAWTAIEGGYDAPSAALFSMSIGAAIGTLLCKPSLAVFVAAGIFGALGILHAAPLRSPYPFTRFFGFD